MSNQVMDELLDRGDELLRQLEATPWWRFIRRRRIENEFISYAAAVYDADQERWR